MFFVWRNKVRLIGDYDGENGNYDDNDEQITKTHKIIMSFE